MRNAKVRTTFNLFKQGTIDGTDENTKVRTISNMFKVFKQATTNGTDEKRKSTDNF